uniref:ABC transporter domain-containing protein n=2 Tax=Ascaris TaxID=6251 RepID=A0A9J2P505_ASCLU
MNICDKWYYFHRLGVCPLRTISSTLNVDMCEEWKMRRWGICSFGMLASALFLLSAVMHIIFLLKAYFSSRTHPRAGYIPFAFVLACTLNLLLIFIPLGYVLYDHEHVSLNAPTVVFICTHAVFWVLLLVIRLATRNELESPWSLVFSELVAMLLALMPIFFWYHWMTLRAHSSVISKRKAFFYILELSSVTFIYFATIASATRRVITSSDSSWSKISKKMALILPYIWPRKSMALQARVLFCVVLLIAGRGLNVYLPLYSKWIVMGGFLNTLRTYLWIPIQQYTTLEIQARRFLLENNAISSKSFRIKTGQVLRIMDRGTTSINGILNYVVFTILPMIMDVLIAVIFFFTVFDWHFGLLVFITMMVYLVLTIIITEWRTKFRRDMNDRENISRAIGVDSLLNYETVKYYNAEHLEVERFADSIRQYQSAEWASSASLSLLNLCQNATIGMAHMIGSLMIAYLISLGKGKLTAGDYVLFTTYMLQLYTPLNFFGTVYRVIQQSFIDMENMFELLAENVEIEDKPDAHPLELHDGSIVFDSVSFGYTSERMVLNGISFAVNKGETVALVGPSGSGKSTIVRLLFRLFDVTDGRILFDGQDIRDVQLKSLRKHIGIVPQDTVLFNETIRYNIRFGNPTANDSQVEEAARMAEIHDRVLSLPQGYDTVVGERGLKLSGGEKQRIAIARTVLKQPRFILLDEATSALDTATERSIQKCLYQMCETRTTLVVAHRLSTIVNANKILVVSQGRITESGTHSQLLEQKGCYYGMWQAQSEDLNNLDGNAQNEPSLL